MKEESEIIFKQIIQTAAERGYAKAREEVPQFTDALFLWVHANKTQEALSAFLSAFVTAAVLESFKYISEATKDGGEDNG